MLSFLRRVVCGVVCIAALLTLPRIGGAQLVAPADDAQSLLKLGAVVHRRITMLARRVQHDLGDARRFHAGTRATCLDNVLSDLHSTQRALEAWSHELQRLEQVTPRLRGMINIFREHLKDLRHEAVGCIRGSGPQFGETQVSLEITGPQPDEDPSRPPRNDFIDVPWVAPR